MKSFILTPAAGKRLIAKAVVVHPAVQESLVSGTVVIIAGTTNGYVVEELFASMGITVDFSRKRFFRGITLPPARSTTDMGRLPDQSEFPGDVIIKKRNWQKGKTIYEVIDDLKKGDVILKGANALDHSFRKAAILIGDPKAGTIGVALQAVVGRRVKLILPVGLEKRITGDLDALASKLNASGAHGLRLLPVLGQVITETNAITMLTGASAELVAAGGVGGAEGCIWLAIDGKPKQMKAAEELIKSIRTEPLFEL